MLSEAAQQMSSGPHSSLELTLVRHGHRMSSKYHFWEQVQKWRNTLQRWKECASKVGDIEADMVVVG